MPETATASSLSSTLHWPSARALPFNEILPFWDDFDDRGTNKAAVRELAQNDRYYLLCKLLKRADAWHPWLYARCREVEAASDGYCDIWAREHYKSTLITLAGSIQEILRDPEITIGIFSHTKSIARGFMAQIQRELESNETLKAAFPDILFADPAKQSRSWSLDGLIVKREGNPKEATIEAHGLVDGQPTSKHFQLMIYDDVVTRESVNTPEQITKTTEAWELSDNLGVMGGRRWIIGTRYHYADTYAEIIKRGAAIARIYPATHDGTMVGRPVLFTQSEWARRIRDQGEATVACHCAGTSILMDDWTYKRIEDVKEGEYVVGVIQGHGKGVSSKLVRTKVLASRQRIANAREYVSTDGNTVRCTPDHLWWTKRTGTDGHAPYAAFNNLKKDDLKSLIRVSNFHGWIQDSDSRWQYLAGILDGEGTANKSLIAITQSKSHNPEVHQRIEQTLKGLAIPYETYERGPNHRSKGSTLFLIRGGRHVRHRILLNCNPAKKKAIVDGLFCFLGGKARTVKERFISYLELGEQPVYTLQTDTGNYVANGFVSKNCQLLANPLAGHQRMFNVEDLQTYEVRPLTLMGYLLIDPARSMKRDSANTAMVVLGIDAAGNKYLLDGVDHKMDLMDRWRWMRDLWNTWKNAPGMMGLHVGYESYGAQADLDYFVERQRIEKASFEIAPLEWPRGGERSKEDRVQRLVPDIRGHRFYLPHPTDDERLTRVQRDMIASGYEYRLSRPIKRKDESNLIYDFTDRFKLQVSYFPFGGLVDIIDAASRIYDLDPKTPEYIDQGSLEPEFV